MLRVAELFAGVGGFRLGLPPPDYRVVWSNQWEPGEKAQWASRCYVSRFGEEGHSNQDIATVPAAKVPAHDLLVGGFPCQDYSVATTKAAGIHGKKGVLWWEIDRIVREKQPKYVLLENVDRLLRSPTTQRGRDFGVVLRCLHNAGYAVEWRALNAADHGYPQKRRRVFVFAARKGTPWGRWMKRHAATPDHLARHGFFARTFPIHPLPDGAVERAPDAVLPESLQRVSDAFEAHFLPAGVATDGKIWTAKPDPVRSPPATLGSILVENAPEDLYIPEADLPRWRYLKGRKAEPRKAENGHRYHYSEGAIPFPDPLDRPARTILTHEGARAPSRFNHVVLDPATDRYRRLAPEEVERLNGFEAGWTAGMPERRRFFCMGNALVVGLVRQMGETLRRTEKDPGAGSAAEPVKLRSPVLEAFRAR